MHTHKLLSRDAGHGAIAAVRGIGDVLARSSGTGARVESVRLGTTVATNALLERKGEPTLLVTTRGFGDALRIGYQHRPDIFARGIRLPPMLYCGGDRGRRARGRGRQSCSRLSTKRRCGSHSTTAWRSGLRSVAIAFLHGVRNPAHELRAAALAAAAGFEEVVASHEVAPLTGLVARGDSAVADAYLSPVLLRYVRQFQRELAGAARLAASCC